MPDYHRNRIAGGTSFLTVNLLDRRSNLLVTQIKALRDAVRLARRRAPFRIEAWVILPDHALHVDPAGRRCRFPGSLARDQGRVLKILARLRTANHPQ
jgi:hypothetical protein